MAATASRAGYTLLELIVVMAILVMLGAVIYPSLEDSYGQFKVTGAADDIKGAWAEARARAIEDCMPYRFAVIPNTTHFRVAPDRAEFWSGGDPPEQSTTGNRPPLVRRGSLPKGVYFGDANGKEPDVKAGKDDDNDDKAPEESSAWTTLAVFLPTGEAQDDVTIKLSYKDAKPVYLQLRALTGTVKTITDKEER
jgi:prepilin-type N-terminal cleavage/methylation domain-containing protein